MRNRRSGHNVERFVNFMVHLETRCHGDIPEHGDDEYRGEVTCQIGGPNAGSRDRGIDRRTDQDREIIMQPLVW